MVARAVSPAFYFFVYFFSGLFFYFFDGVFFGENYRNCVYMSYVLIFSLLTYPSARYGFFGEDRDRLRKAPIGYVLIFSFLLLYIFVFFADYFIYCNKCSRFGDAEFIVSAAAISFGALLSISFLFRRIILRNPRSGK